MSKANEIGTLMAKSTLLYAEWAKQQGISYNLLAVFYSIFHNPQCTQKTIAEQWALPKQTVFSLCKKLKMQGDLTFAQESMDKREKFLRLTENGFAFANPIIERVKKLEREILAEFGEAEADHLVKELQRLIQIIETKTQE